MKHIFILFIFLLSTLTIYGQVPGGINYQVVLRGADGGVISNESATVSASISDANGNTFSESIGATSDAFGVINVVIGSQDLQGELNDLDWDQGGVTLSVSVTSASGSVDMGTTQLLSVPFAFYAANSGSSIEGPEGPQGAQGAEGPQGPQGDQGPQGIQGPQGDNGADGSGVTIVGSVASPNDLPTNYQGNIGDMYIVEENGGGYVWDGNTWINVGQIQGPDGAQGPQGIQGTQGIQGPQGAQGAQGMTGPAGPIGPQGAQGTQGLQGATGPIGPQGDTGAQGSQGPAGQTGAQGMTGAQGPQGDDGPQGPQGMTGPQGMVGPQGPQGDDGAQGPQGMTGPQGPTGMTGPQGSVGPAGTYTAGAGISLVGGTIANTGDTNAANDITNTTSAGGDLSGTYPNPLVSSLNGVDLSSITPGEGQVLKYNSQNNTLEYQNDADSNPWLGIPGGVAYNGVEITNNEISFGTGDGSIQSISTALTFQWNNASRFGYYNSSTELGPTNNNTINLGSTNFRWATVWSTNGLNQTSDERLKKNIVSLDYGLSTILDMNPVSYEWKDNTGGKKLGFLAQEMEKVVPEVISYQPMTAAQRDSMKEDGRTPGEDAYAMNYSELIPILVKAIQEQQVQIEDLQKQVEELKK